MKKIAYFFAVGAMSLAACSSDPAYKISGTVEGVADGEYVYLQEGKGREWIKVDSAAVAGGAFTFNGRQDAAAYRYITYNAEGKRYRADFFLENGNIAVALGETSTATGTPNNDLYQAYKNEAAPLNKAIAEISKKFREGNLTDEQKEQLSKLEKMINDAKETVAEKVEEAEAAKNEATEKVENVKEAVEGVKDALKGLKK